MSDAEREIVSSRWIAAEREEVALAFRDPARLARWWGPEGFRNTIHEFDLRPGGQWRLEMVGPDGTVYPNESEFREVTPERIVLVHLRPMHRFELTMTFAEQAAGTLVTWRMVFDTAEECARCREYVVAGNEGNFNRLERVLAESAQG